MKTKALILQSVIALLLLTSNFFTTPVAAERLIRVAQKNSLASPGVTYYYHAALGGYAQVTAWATKVGDQGYWKSRIRISWQDSAGVRHESGSEYDGFMSGFDQARAASANGGSTFAWLEQSSPRKPWPVLFAAWSDGTTRLCSKIDIFDPSNTHEFFNINPGDLYNHCPSSFTPTIQQHMTVFNQFPFFPG